MKSDFVHVAPSTGLTVCLSVTPISDDILNYLGANFTQNSRNVVFQSWNCLWIIRITSVFNGTLQEEVQRCQIAATRRPIDISWTADYAVVKLGAQKVDRKSACMACGAILLKPKVVHIHSVDFRP